MKSGKKKKEERNFSEKANNLWKSLRVKAIFYISWGVKENLRPEKGEY